MELFLSIFPIVLLIYLMVKRNAFPSYVALPLIGGLVYLLQLFYFKNEFIILNANIGITKPAKKCIRAVI